MVNCRILLSETGEVVVKHDTPVRILVQRGLHPAVVCNGNYFYPRSWHGVICPEGEVVRWEYPAGPIEQVEIQTDPEGQRWVSIVWR